MGNQGNEMLADVMIDQGIRAVIRLLPFIDISAAEIEFLRSLPGKEVTIAAGETIAPAHPTESFDLILEGWAANAVTTQDGLQRINSINLPGDMIGMATFILTEPFDTTFALSDVMVRRLPGTALRDMFEEQPRLAATVMLIAQEERAAKLEWNSLCNTTGAYRRLAAFIFRLLERLEVLHDTPHEDYPFPVTQKQVGEVVGVTPVYINHLVRKMDQDGLVKLKGKRLKVINRAALQGASGLSDWKIGRPRWLPEAIGN